jgi:hypothetical protein
MKDGRFLHFLKSFPAPLLLSALFILVLWLYLRTNDLFLQRVIDTILGGLLGVVTGRGISQAQTGNTTTGDVNITEEAPIEEIKVSPEP